MVLFKSKNIVFKCSVLVSDLPLHCDLPGKKSQAFSLPVSNFLSKGNNFSVHGWWECVQLLLATRENVIEALWASLSTDATWLNIYTEKNIHRFL